MRNYFESSKPIDNNRKLQKKVVVEVGDGVAHAQAVHQNSNLPEYTQKFKNGEVKSDQVVEITEPVEAEEFESTAESKIGLKNEISYHKQYSDAVQKRVGDNLKTIKKNTPDKHERDNRGQIREFIGKL